MESALKEHLITQEELIDACIHIGNDFGSGTHGIGFKTYLKRKDELKLTEDQEKIKKYMLTPYIAPTTMVAGHFDLDHLAKWLDARGLRDQFKKYMKLNPVKPDPFEKGIMCGKEWMAKHMTIATPKPKDDDLSDDLSELSDLSD